MKKNITKIALGAFIALGVLNSCDTDNVNPLQTAATAEFGAYARVIDISSDVNANILDVSSSTFDVSIEFVDNEGGSLITEYKVYTTFRDQTIADEDAPDYSISDEALLYSFDSSSFTAGESWPQLSFSINAADAIEALNLDLANASGGDALNYRGEITLSDGRTFSSTNSGVSINSELFYNDAFSFSSQFVCDLAVPNAGDYIIEMNDSYGDGWNGAAITVIVDGVGTDYTLDDGSTTTLTVNVPEGTSSLSFEFVSGDWDSEITFKITSPKGNVIANDGPSPSIGTITLDLCSE